MDLFSRILTSIILSFSDLPSDGPTLARKAGSCGPGMTAGGSSFVKGAIPRTRVILETN